LKINFRNAVDTDLSFLVNLEQEVFPVFQQNTKENLRYGIRSKSQEVLIVETAEKEPIGSLVLIKYKHTLRFYSMAILNQYQNNGIGRILFDYVINFGEENGFSRILLEVRAKNERLVHWYKNRGFKTLKTLKHYYNEDEDALKMELVLSNHDAQKYHKNIIVIDKPYKWERSDINAKIVSVKEYINNSDYHNNPDLRIFNLCSSYKYQSFGYYVSLLASARGQRAIPNIVTIRDFKNIKIIKSATFELEDLINKELQRCDKNILSLNIYFGETAEKRYKLLTQKLFQLFETPLFRITFVKHERWLIKNMKVLTIKNMPAEDKEIMYDFAVKYLNKKRFNYPKLDNYKYDLAVLINPKETNPPSNEEALKQFVTAANRKGVYLEFITQNDIDKINEFDALFIRETTNVNHYTYDISRLAYAEGLVVIDDPWSILRCSNKIYQHELLKRNKIKTPITIALTKNLQNKELLSQISYPVILKQPDSAFSLGVVKVNSREEAETQLNILFKTSDMIVCQEFLFSDFDWRIGVLDNKALYACKYFMTKGHWQIYDWNSNSDEKEGAHETVALEEVPAEVLSVAQKAASLIGDGLYGVDLKFINGETYVVEVNDNPNIDFGVEDQYLKEKLYDAIIDSIINRIEQAKNIRKINLT